MRPQAETALRDLMTANKITVQPAIAVAPAVVAEAPAIEPAKSEEQTAVQPASAPAVSSTGTTPQAFYLVAALASILIAVGAALVLRRRTSSQPSV